MGLGKTILTLALILANPSQDSKCSSTLVICPVSLIKQWTEEVKSKTESLKVYSYYGAKRKFGSPIFVNLIIRSEVS
jgi:SNF2 family DNA or RNA helicase